MQKVYSFIERYDYTRTVLSFRPMPEDILKRTLDDLSSFLWFKT